MMATKQVLFDVSRLSNREKVTTAGGRGKPLEQSALRLENRHHLQNAGSKYCNHAHLPRRLHLQPPDHHGGDHHHPDVQRGVDGRVRAAAVPDVVVGAVGRHVQVELAAERDGDEAGGDDVRDGQEGVEDLRGGQDAAEAGPLEDALVEEEDGRLAEAQPDGVHLAAGKVDAPEVGHFPVVEGPVVLVETVVVYCKGMRDSRGY